MSIDSQFYNTDYTNQKQYFIFEIHFNFVGRLFLKL